MYYLVTGTLFIDGFGDTKVYEIVYATSAEAATTHAEIMAAIFAVGHANSVMEWRDKTVEQLPTDQVMVQLGAETAPRLPGVE